MNRATTNRAVTRTMSCVLNLVPIRLIAGGLERRTGGKRHDQACDVSKKFHVAILMDVVPMLQLAVLGESFSVIPTAGLP